MNRSREFMKFLEQGDKYTGTAIGPSLPVKIQDAKVGQVPPGFRVEPVGSGKSLRFNLYYRDKFMGWFLNKDEVDDAIKRIRSKERKINKTMANLEDQKGKAPRLDAKVKKQANEYLSDFCKEYYSAIPVTDLFKALKEKFGIVALQEDGTEWAGILSGDQGKMTVDIGPRQQFPEYPKSGEPGLSTYPIYMNSMLVFSWYRMPESGRFEINAYIS